MGLGVADFLLERRVGVLAGLVDDALVGLGDLPFSTSGDGPAFVLELGAADVLLGLGVASLFDGLPAAAGVATFFVVFFLALGVCAFALELCIMLFGLTELAFSRFLLGESATALDFKRLCGVDGSSLAARVLRLDATEISGLVSESRLGPDLVAMAAGGGLNGDAGPLFRCDLN